VGNAVPHPGTGSLLKNSVVASFLSYGIWPLKFTTGRDVPRGDAHAPPPPGTISNDASHPFQAWKGGYENPENPNKIQAKFSPDPDPKDKSKTEP
jgi:hypothetical protein